MNQASRVTALLCARGACLKSLQMTRMGLSLAQKRVVAPCQRTSFIPAVSSRLLSSDSSPPKFDVINVQGEEDFKSRVLDASSKIPVVVDFHATWCGPCKLLGPRLESLLSQEQGKVVMAKVDIDDLSDLAMEYGVRSVPTVIAVKNGKVCDQFIGLQDDDKIKQFIDKLVVS